MNPIELLVTGAFPLDEREVKALNRLGYHVSFQLDEQKMTENPEKYEAVLCNSLFAAQDIRAFRSLRMIQLTSAGLDRIPVSYVKDHGIALLNASDAYCLPMAEWAVWGILSLYKNADFFYKNRQERIWEKNREIRELNGAIVHIYGFGHFGRALAHRLRPFGCKITALDVYPFDHEDADEVLMVTDARADASLPEADIVVAAMPLNEKTRNFFDARRLSLLKSTAVFVNLARGGLVDEAALTDLLLSGKLFGAVLDVFEIEPLPKDSPLWSMDRVFLTPHNSFVGNGDHKRLWEIIFKNLSSFAEEYANRSSL